VVLACDHASNDLKYTKVEDREEEWVRSAEYFDVGAADFTFSLSESLRCLAVLGNFTKLYVDPAKPLLDSNLIRHHYQWQRDEAGLPVPVSFNNQGYRLYERLENFYLEYHKVLKEALEYVEPSCVVSVHSHDPDTSPGLPDICLYHPRAASSQLCQALQTRFS